MDVELITRIINDSNRSYGSILKPNWSFVEKQYKKNPYCKIIEKLLVVGNIEDTTDLNCDVSIAMHINFGFSEATLRLSLVGKYACVNYSDGTFLRAQQCVNTCLSTVLGILIENNVAILRSDDLVQQIAFGGRPATIYEVLFSADEAI